MTIKDRIDNEYFEWLTFIVCGERYSNLISFNKLLTYLHSVEFTYSILMDENRAIDGIGLRRRFATSQECEEISDYIEGPCSVLEMMVALSIRCETFMDDTTHGDRTGQWFWGMITNLGLGAMTDNRFDIQYVEDIIERFLNREYASNGKGGLFTVNCGRDLRKVEIWHQLCWYLDLYND